MELIHGCAASQHTHGPSRHDLAHEVEATGHDCNRFLQQHGVYLALFRDLCKQRIQCISILCCKTVIDAHVLPVTGAPVPQNNVIASTPRKGMLPEEPFYSTREVSKRRNHCKQRAISDTSLLNVARVHLTKELQTLCGCLNVIQALTPARSLPDNRGRRTRLTILQATWELALICAIPILVQLPRKMERLARQKERVKPVYFQQLVAMRLDIGEFAVITHCVAHVLVRLHQNPAPCFCSRFHSSLIITP
mmetsp:Transcript_27741/g.50750  ORF Transcript_27741/g.50750 Transcript_27741/m.50750 type:complete len:250 (-) Transcript_27741:412-1161(-)